MADTVSPDPIFDDTELDEIEIFFTKINTRRIMLTQELEGAHQNVINPILKVPTSSNIINGIICLKIENLNDIIKGIDWNITSFSCKLAYQFNNINTKTKQHYYNEPMIRNFDSIRSDGFFWLKVPLFLLPYSMEFEFVICFEDIINQHITFFKSQEHKIEIPSILLENVAFNIGDDVQYCVDNAAYVISGTITKLLENDMIEIKTHPEYIPFETSQDKIKLFVIKPKESVSKDCIQRMFVEDLTHIAAAYNDLVLRIGNNEEAFEIFINLIICVESIYDGLWVNDMIDFEHVDFMFIGELTTIYIFEYLYSKKYYYRMNCMICNEELFGNTQWCYNICKNIINYKKGIETVETQDAWNCTGYSCDLCRIEVRYFEQMWHCNADENNETKHDFCMSCVHFMMQQYYEMQHFLINLLDGIVFKDIIEEIVVFCVGKVNKFDVE